METIYSFLFEPFFLGDYLDLLLRVLFFFVIWLLLFYVLVLVISKFKSKFKKELQVKFSLLWSLVILQFIFVVYLFFLFRLQSLSFFNWTDGMFYLGFLPQLLFFFGTIILFVVKIQDFKRSSQL